MLREELKMQNFIYNQPEAKCDFCKATENPHPDYDETIPITRIDIGIKRKIEHATSEIDKAIICLCKKKNGLPKSASAITFEDE